MARERDCSAVTGCLELAALASPAWGEETKGHNRRRNQDQLVQTLQAQPLG